MQIILYKTNNNNNNINNNNNNNNNLYYFRDTFCGIINREIFKKYNILKTKI